MRKQNLQQRYGGQRARNNIRAQPTERHFERTVQVRAVATEVDERRALQQHTKGMQDGVAV